MKLLRIFAVIIAALALAFIPHSRPEKPNIVLISIDTLRADYFTPEHMPLTYEWAKEHGQIAQAQAAATWTKPSHVSILTGLTPEKHKVAGIWSAIPESLSMIQDDLKKAGYHTAAFVGGGFVSEHFGFSHGFSVFKQVKNEQKWARRPVQFILAPLQWAKTYALQYQDKQPLFLFVHMYGPHNYKRRTEENADWSTGLQSAVTESATPEATLREWYASDVRECDAEIANFLETISSTFAVIILTSDHGEYLGEQWNDSPRFGHGGPKGRLLLAVPLVACGIKAPFALTEIRSVLCQAAGVKPMQSTAIHAINVQPTESMTNQLRALGYLN